MFDNTPITPSWKLQHTLPPIPGVADTFDRSDLPGRIADGMAREAVIVADDDDDGFEAAAVAIAAERRADANASLALARDMGELAGQPIEGDGFDDLYQPGK